MLTGQATCQGHDHDYLEPLRDAPEVDEFDAEFPPDEVEGNALILLAGETAGRNPAARRENPDDLGERTEDWQYDWSFHVNTYREPHPVLSLGDQRTQGNNPSMPDIHAGPHWWAKAKENYDLPSRVDFQSDEVVSQLAPQQRLIYDTIIQHYDTQSREQLLLNIDGRAGTGKSFIIQCYLHTSNSVHLERLSSVVLLLVLHPSVLGVARSTLC